MKAVLDTNILVSALLNPHGAPGAILGLVLEGELTLCCDTRILLEYMEVLQRPKFGFGAEEINILLDFLKKECVMFSPLPLNLNMPDKDDLPFAETAVCTDADYLITGNSAHFPKKIGKVIVAAPAPFLQAWLKRQG